MYRQKKDLIKPDSTIEGFKSMQTFLVCQKKKTISHCIINDLRSTHVTPSLPSKIILDVTVVSWNSETTYSRGDHKFNNWSCKCPLYNIVWSSIGQILSSLFNSSDYLWFSTPATLFSLDSIIAEGKCNVFFYILYYTYRER